MTSRLNLNLVRAFLISIGLIGVSLVATLVLAQSPTPSPAATGGLNIQYPIEDLGGCNSLAECSNFCEDPVNYNSCADFARRNGFYQDDPTTYADDEFWTDAQASLGCGSAEACYDFCSQPDNHQTCADFATDNSIPGGYVEDVADPEILDAAQEVLGCDSTESCQDFCSDPANNTACSEFAGEVGLIGGEVTEGPGGCQSGETCSAYCSDPNNYTQCAEFAGGNFAGPGGCTDDASCRNYCEENPESCRSYSPGANGVYVPVVCAEGESHGPGGVCTATGDTAQAANCVGADNYWNGNSCQDNPPVGIDPEIASAHFEAREDMGGCSTPGECYDYCVENQVNGASVCSGFSPGSGRPTDNYNPYLYYTPGDQVSFTPVEQLGGCTSPAGCYDYCQDNPTSCPGFSSNSPRPPEIYIPGTYYTPPTDTVYVTPPTTNFYTTPVYYTPPQGSTYTTPQYYTPGMYSTPTYQTPTAGSNYTTPNYYTPWNNYPTPTGEYPTPTYSTPTYYTPPIGTRYSTPYYYTPPLYTTPYYYTPGGIGYSTPNYQTPPPYSTPQYYTPFQGGGYLTPVYFTPINYNTPSYYTPPAGSNYTSPSYYTPPTAYTTPRYYTPGTYPTPPTYSTPPPYSTPTGGCPPGSGPGCQYNTPVGYSTPSYYTPPIYYYPTPGSGYTTPVYSTPSYYTPGGTYSSPYYTPGSGYTSPTTQYSYPSPGGYYTPTAGSSGTATYYSPSDSSYSTPSGTYYVSPSYYYPSPGGSDQTPVYGYPTPGSGYTYPTPNTYYYPTPSDSYTYPSPGTNYGTPSYGTPSGTSGYGTPTYGTPAYGSPAYGTPSYNTPPYETPTYGTPSYGTPSYGTPSESYATPVQGVSTSRGLFEVIFDLIAGN